ncbi:MAG: metal ABC transporter ATP-binding protein [Clostridia bacterium]
MDNIINIDNISFSYSGLKVLDALSFSVQKGEFISILGANGSGKSTLFKLILTELYPDKGKISLFGKPVGRQTEWRKVGYLAQNSISLSENFPASVLEVVTTGLYAGFMRGLFSGGKQKAIAALELVGMGGYKDRLISKLSGGERQRVMLARLFASGAELLLLDEPTAGVDAQTSLEVHTLLKEKCDNSGITVVEITHNSFLAESFSDRVFCIEAGNLMELSKAQLELEHRYKHKHNKGGEGGCC